MKSLYQIENLNLDKKIKEFLKQNNFTSLSSIDLLTGIGIEVSKSVFLIPFHETEEGYMNFLFIKNERNEVLLPIYTSLDNFFKIKKEYKKCDKLFVVNLAILVQILLDIKELTGLIINYGENSFKFTKESVLSLFPIAKESGFLPNLSEYKESYDITNILNSFYEFPNNIPEECIDELITYGKSNSDIHKLYIMINELSDRKELFVGVSHTNCNEIFFEEIFKIVSQYFKNKDLIRIENLRKPQNIKLVKNVNPIYKKEKKETIL